MQEVPIKVYRTSERLTVAAPTPGLLPEDLTVRITAENRLVLEGRDHLKRPRQRAQGRKKYPPADGD